ncbi:hypothetical protein [Kitasatospora sp. NPDC057223]|uniref:hypothetical protein n=1 Tax=Kitasatospora sp. NPDC057223 TaxID=3346055 RepID=UPI00363F6325
MKPTATSPTEHAVTVRAPAATLLRLLTEVRRWPVLLEHVVYALPADAGATPAGRARFWTRDGERVTRWDARHDVTFDGLRIDFRYNPVPEPVLEPVPKPAPKPVPESPAVTAAPAPASGCWALEPLGPGTTRLTLRQDAAGPSPLGPDVLDALRRHGESLHGPDELVFTFQDTVRTDGSPEAAYEFLWKVQDWPGAVSHIATVSLTQSAPGVQHVLSGVRAADGSVQDVPSVRLGLARDRVVYTPLTVPPFASAHLGEWIVGLDAKGTTTITGRHTVALRADRIAAAFGPAATPADARRRVRTALGAHSLATLDAARAHAETRTPATATPTAIGGSR